MIDQKGKEMLNGETLEKGEVADWKREVADWKREVDIFLEVSTRNASSIKVNKKSFVFPLSLKWGSVYL